MNGYYLQREKMMQEVFKNAFTTTQYYADKKDNGWRWTYGKTMTNIKPKRSFQMWISKNKISEMEDRILRLEAIIKTIDFDSTNNRLRIDCLGSYLGVDYVASSPQYIKKGKKKKD